TRCARRWTPPRATWRARFPRSASRGARSKVEVDGARPGLRTVLLSHPDPIRMAPAARRGRVGVIEREGGCLTPRRQAAQEHPQIDPSGRKRERTSIGEVAELDLELDDWRVESKRGAGRRIDRDVDAVVVAGRVRDPGDARVGPLANSLFRIFHRERNRVDDASGGELDVAVPRGESVAPPDPGAGPGDPVLVRALERARVVWRHLPYMLEPAEHIDALDGPRPDRTPRDHHRAFGAPGGPHRQAVHGELDVNSLGARDGVAAARLDRVEHGLPRQRLGEHASEPAVCAERRGAWVARAGPALVAVGVRHEAYLVAVPDRVLEEPFEAPPVRIDLDDRLQRDIVEAYDVGVAAADVRDQHDVVTAGELAEELGHREAVGGGIAHVVYLGVRRAMQRGDVASEHDVAIAGARGHPGPFVADEDHAAAVLVEAIDLAAQPPPFLVGDLKVVRLVAHHVEQRHLAPEGEILLDRPGADRGARLAVEIAPPGLRLAGTNGPNQVRLGTVVAARGDDARLAAGIAQAY